MNTTVLDLAQKLIAIPSTADKPEKIEETLTLIKNEFSQTEFEVKEFEDKGVKSLLVSNKPGATHFSVVLNAHVDVVDAKEAQFTPEVKNGKLFGRGSYDMKTAAAVMIVLFKDIAKDLDFPLGLQIVTDEETGGFHGTKHQVEQGVSADMMIAGENTDLKINNEAKGIIWIKISTTGKTAHGAYPWLGENAIWNLQEALEKIKQAFPVPSEAVWETTVNLSQIQTDNKSVNKVPDNASATFDVRYIPQDRETFVEKFKQLLPEGVHCEVLVNESSQYAAPDNSYIKKLDEAIRSITGKKTEYIAMNGGSDARFYSEKNTPAVCFGLSGYGHHSDEEWVSIESIETYYTILQTFLTSL